MAFEIAPNPRAAWKCLFKEGAPPCRGKRRPPDLGSEGVRAELCKEMGLQCVAVETEVDHVHIVFKAAPTDQLSKILHRFKGVTSRRLFQEFPVIKNRLWGGHLWSPSYFVVTVGGAPLEAIRKYVENQRTKGYGQKQNDKRKSK